MVREASRLALLLLLCVGLALLASGVMTAWTVHSNEWVHFELYELIRWELLRGWLATAGIVLLVAGAAYVLHRLMQWRLGDRQRADRKFSIILALVAGIALAVTWGFHVNRYVYKSFWKPENAQSIAGLKVPAGLLSAKLWAINLGILLVAVLSVVVCAFLLRLFLRRTEGLLTRLSARWPLALAGALVLLVAFVLLTRGPLPDSPNIILISIDTLRADRLSGYGHDRHTSPSIDALAETGVLFENAISQANWTLPSHLSIMTSQVPLSHGVQARNQRLADFKVTLAELLRNAGYRTVAFTGGRFVDARFGFDQGFDLYSHGNPLYYHTSEEWIRDGQAIRLTNLLPDVLGWLSRHRDDPFFLFLHCWDTHAPYLPHEGYIERYSDGYEGAITSVTHDMVTALKHAPEKASAEDAERIRALYDNEIRYVDDYLGQLFGELRKMELFDNTIIVFTSDHGDQLLEHGMGHGVHLFEPDIHVPLIMTYPPVLPAGARVSSVVRSIDIVPTVLELARIDVPEPVATEIQGRSLVGSWDEPQPETRALSLGSKGRKLALRGARYKYVATSSGDAMSSTVEQVYDLDSDPDEKRDLGLEDPELTLEMRDRLGSHLQELPTVRHAGTSDSVALGDDFKDQLRALGYLQ